MPNLKLVQDSGIHWGFGTDAFEVNQFRPFTTLGWAVTGKLLGAGAGKVTMKYPISREDALVAHTRNNAYFLNRENDLGSIAAGKLADMFVAIERAQSTAYFAAATIAEDDPRRTVASAMAKAAAGECQRLVAQDGIQLLGGIGYTWEHDAHLLVKRMKAGEQLFGSSAHHRARIADLLGV